MDHTERFASELRGDIQRDEEYLRGFQTGWNLGLDEDTEKLEAIKRSRQSEIDRAKRELTT